MDFISEKIAKSCDLDLMTLKWGKELKKFIKSITKGKNGEVIKPSPNLQIYFDAKNLVLKHKRVFWIFNSLGSRSYTIKEGAEDMELSKFLDLININDFTNKNQVDIKNLIADLSIDEADPWVDLLKSHLTSLKFS